MLISLQGARVVALFCFINTHLIRNDFIYLARSSMIPANALRLNSSKTLRRLVVEGEIPRGPYSGNSFLSQI